MFRHGGQLVDLEPHRGRAHVTDASNASRTPLYNIHTGDWDEKLLGLMSRTAQRAAASWLVLRVRSRKPSQRCSGR